MPVAECKQTTPDVSDNPDMDTSVETAKETSKLDVSLSIGLGSMEMRQKPLRCPQPLTSSTITCQVFLRAVQMASFIGNKSVEHMPLAVEPSTQHLEEDAYEVYRPRRVMT